MNDQNVVSMGRVEGEAADVYHGMHAVSASRLRVFARNPGGPQLYHQRYVAKSLEDSDSEAMLEGRAIHCLALEGAEKFAREYVTVPEDAPKRPTKAQLNAKKPGPATVAAVRWWSDFDAANAGREVITGDMLARVECVERAIRGHPLAAQLFARGEAEMTWRVRAPGLPHLPPLQCRPDWFCAEGCELTDGRPFILDIKTTGTLDEEEFGSWQRGFELHGYHRQAAFYMAILDLLGVDVRDFLFVVPEKCAPYGVKIGRLNDRALAQGQDEVARLLMRLDECYGRNLWPNAPLGLLDFNLSARYYARAAEKGGEL